MEFLKLKLIQYAKICSVTLNLIYPQNEEGGCTVKHFPWKLPSTRGKKGGY